MRAVAPSPVLQVIPIVDFPARLVFGVAVSFLNFAFQLVLFSVDHIKIIVRKLAPLLFDLALHLLSVSFHAIPIHNDLLYDDTTTRASLSSSPRGLVRRDGESGPGGMGLAESRPPSQQINGDRTAEFCPFPTHARKINWRLS